MTICTSQAYCQDQSQARTTVPGRDQGLGIGKRRARSVSGRPLADRILGGVLGVPPPPIWQAADARGSGAGWNVTISSTDFSSADGVISVPNFKVRLRPEKVVPVSGNTPPTSQILTFQPLSGSPLKILSAAPGDGMGSYDFIPDFRLTVPAETSEGAYQAILTVSISSGP